MILLSCQSLCVKSHLSFVNFLFRGKRLFGNRKVSNIQALTENNSSSEDLFHLINPLLILTVQTKRPNSLLPSIAADLHSGLLNLSLKSTLKLDKKLKKPDKDEDRDVDRTAVKLKLKKKTRSKVAFDEDFESVIDLFESTLLAEDVSLLSIARPLKPDKPDLGSFSFTIKQKVSGTNFLKKRKSVISSRKKEIQTFPMEKPKTVTLMHPITVQELADLCLVSKTEIIKSLFLKGIAVTVNQIIDLSTAQKLGEEFGTEILLNVDFDSDFMVKKPLEITNRDITLLVSRPPIITIMGHVDHGKTTLLDKIRKTQTAQKEAGGITQKIGAYEVNLFCQNASKKLVFLDTPGHAAFSGMRSRGVSITDIAVLVVAADDGVKPQTLEAIRYIQSANVPLIIAINKIDKEDANIESIKEKLAEYNLIAEDWGGDIVMVPISALQGTNVDTLLEMIVLLSEMLNLKANPNSLASGTVIESNLDRTKGAVASLIVQEGTLYLGDIVKVGSIIAKVRGMVNSLGEPIREATPSSPVFIWGFSKVPSVGDHFAVFKDEKDAKSSIDSENLKSNSISQSSDTYVVSDSENKERINLVIKTDTQGSAEAITSMLNKLHDPKVQIRILYVSAGEITETDVEFAFTSNAKLLAFNTTSASGAKKAAKNMALTIEEFDVIYDLFDYVHTLIDKLVGPEYEEVFIGSAIVKNIFPLAKSFVAGTYVNEGKILKSAYIHVIRDAVSVYKGLLTSLKQLKEDVVEVNCGSECGIFITNFDSWKEGDVIKIFELNPKKKTYSIIYN